MASKIAESEAELNEADEALLIKAQNMNIHQYVPTRKTGKYDDQVQTLIAVDESTGYQNSIEILVPAAEAKKHKKWFGDSARGFDKSARIVNGDLGKSDGGDGVLLEFVLTDKVLRSPNKAKPAAETPTPA